MKSPQKQLRPALYFLGFLLFLALARDILANGRPLWCKINGQRYWPGLRTVWADEHKPYGIRILDSLEENQQWQRFRYEAAFFAPIPFSPGDYIRNPSVSFSKPGENHPGFPPGFRHWLGTDEQGRDVAAALVAGARVAVFTGALAMAIALGIGLLLGAVAGYFGDDRLRLPRGVIWLNMLGLPFASMYAYFIRADAISRHAAVPWGMEVIVFVLILLIFNVLYFALRRLPYLRKPVSVPADILIMRLAEVFNSIPRMILLIVVATLGPKQSLWVLIAVIGALSWTGVAKFVRSELLRVRELEYVTAARGLGYSEWRILLRHALPNALRPALIAFSFGVGGAIVLEASLTFLGFGGNSFRGVSWGSLLLSMKGHEKIWWVGLPAGLIIAFTVIALNTIGEQMNNARR
ncbi:MAG: ABC transporter permease [Saprospiraceae bacterium]